MSFLRKLFVFFTIIFVLFVGANIYVANKSQTFKTLHQPFVNTFMQDLSQTWRLQDIQSRVDDAFLEKASTDEGKAYLDQFSTLGLFQEMQEVEMGKYYSGSKGTMGEFIFKAKFERELVLARVTINALDGNVQVLGITINSMDEKGHPIDFKPIN